MLQSRGRTVTATRSSLCLDDGVSNQWQTRRPSSLWGRGEDVEWWWLGGRSQKRRCDSDKVLDIHMHWSCVPVLFWMSNCLMNHKNHFSLLIWNFVPLSVSGSFANSECNFDQFSQNIVLSCLCSEFCFVLVCANFFSGDCHLRHIVGDPLCFCQWTFFCEKCVLGQNFPSVVEAHWCAVQSVQFHHSFSHYQMPLSLSAFESVKFLQQCLCCKSNSQCDLLRLVTWHLSGLLFVCDQRIFWCIMPFCQKVVQSAVVRMLKKWLLDLMKLLFWWWVAWFFHVFQQISLCVCHCGCGKEMCKHPIESWWFNVPFRNLF